MPKLIDLTGQIFTRLTVTSQAEMLGGCVAWNCICECGKSVSIRGATLRSGHTKSCGCLDRDAVILRNTTHGLGKPPGYTTWFQMKQRCTKPRNPAYPRYGGRGIFVCERWLKFENFFSDMGEMPKGMSLDRIDNDGPYSPENCRWATDIEQANNKRNNHLITFTGKTQTMPAWAREIGISRCTIKDRLARGWSAERALMTPVKT